MKNRNTSIVFIMLKVLALKTSLKSGEECVSFEVASLIIRSGLAGHYAVVSRMLFMSIMKSLFQTRAASQQRHCDQTSDHASDPDCWEWDSD